MLPPLPPSPNTSTALPAQADADPGPATAAGPFETLIGRALLLGLATADAEPKAGTDEPSKSPPGASKKATSEDTTPQVVMLGPLVPVLPGVTNSVSIPEPGSSVADGVVGAGKSPVVVAKAADGEAGAAYRPETSPLASAVGPLPTPAPAASGPQASASGAIRARDSLLEGRRLAAVYRGFATERPAPTELPADTATTKAGRQPERAEVIKFPASCPTLAARAPATPVNALLALDPAAAGVTPAGEVAMQGTAREEIDSEIVAGRIEEPKAPFSSNPLEASTGKLTLIPPVAEPTGPPQEAGKLGFDPPAPRDGPDPAPIPIQGVETPAKSNHGSADPIPSLPSTPPIDGTTSAKEQPGMKKAEKMIKSAELTQQNLPGEASASATPQKTPGKLASPAQTSSLLAPNITANPNPAASEPTSAAPATSGPAVESRLLEQTREMIVSHAVRLHQSGTDTLRVVIQPGGGVELALELRQLNDGIQAQAVLHRGDFQQLSEHWSELQQRLAPTGVQLSALQPPASTAGTGQQFPTPERHRSHQQQSPRNAIAEAAFGGAMTEPPAPRRVRAKTYRGWESWA